MSERDSLPAGAGPAAVDGSKNGRESERKGTRAASGGFEVSQEPLLAGNDAGETPAGEYLPAPAYEHLGDLPPTYGSQSVYLVAYDPRQLFAYWDVDPANAQQTGFGLRVCRADGEVESEQAINLREAGRYLPTALPGGTYYVELGTTGRAGRWRPVAFSGRVTLPPLGLAGESEPKFATLPFHLSFQRLLELIQDAMGQGEDLTATLARLQAGDRQGIETLVGTLASLSREQLQTLERLLGHQVDAGTSSGASSEDWALAAAGAGGSEVPSSQAYGSETLSSQAFGSETLASGASGSETLGSGGGFGSAESFPLAAGAFGSETLASGGAGFGVESMTSLEWSLSSQEILSGLGIHSEVWSLASGGAGLDSEALSSNRMTGFFRSLESNISDLTSMFSATFAGLNGEFLNSESGSSTGSGSV